MRYAMCSTDGTVVNVVEWDGETDYDPGLKLVLVDDDTAVSPGDRVSPRGRILRRAEPVETPPSLEDRLAALEARLEGS